VVKHFIHIFNNRS